MCKMSSINDKGADPKPETLHFRVRDFDLSKLLFNLFIQPFFWWTGGGRPWFFYGFAFRVFEEHRTY